MKNDVLAVNMASRKVRILASGKDERNAEAIISMAIMRRGVEEEFYVAAEAGTYREGDVYV